MTIVKIQQRQTQNCNILIKMRFASVSAEKHFEEFKVF